MASTAIDQVLPHYCVQVSAVQDAMSRRLLPFGTFVLAHSLGTKSNGEKQGDFAKRLRWSVDESEKA